MGKIYINDLANVLIEKHKVSKSTAQLFLNSIVSCIQDGISDDKLVKIKGLGTFKTVDVEPRESVAVNTGERVVIEGHQKLTFVADPQLKALVNKPFSQFETTVLNEGVVFDEASLAEALGGQTEMPLVELADEDDEAEEPIEKDVPAEEEPAPAEQGAPPAEEEPAPIEPLLEIVDQPADEVEEPTTEEPAVAPEAEPAAAPDAEPIAAVEPANSEPSEEVHTEEVHTEEEPIEEPSEEVSSEDEPSEDEPIDEEPINEEDMRKYFDEERRKRDAKISPWLWLFLAVAACAASFVAGYYVGTQKHATAVEAEVVEAAASSDEQQDTPAQAAKDSLAAASQAQTSPAQAQQPQQPQSPQSQQAQQPQAQTPQPQAGNVPDWKKYEDMDRRLYYGAYVIIGTDQVLKAKDGETTSRLARRTLGDGMECYIEVYNGLANNAKLEAGQEVKIPKLKTKKALKKEMEQQQKSE